MRYSTPYSAYARVYDRIGQRHFGEQMATTILRLLEQRGVAPRCVLDLGCGTGAATIAFALAGLRATGIDQSPDMLNRAREAAAKAGVTVDLLEGDMTGFHLDRPFDLLTAIYDSVNYLDGGSQVTEFACSAYAALEPGGYLFFDLNTRRRLMSSWEHGMMLAGDSENLYVTYRSWYDEALDASPLVLTAFVREFDDCWSRFDEEHVERSWPIVQVESWLEEAGFRVDEVVGYVDSTGDLIRPASEEHGRVLFIASRRSLTGGSNG